MKRSIAVLSLALMAGITLFGCSKGYQKQSMAGDLMITLSVDRYPLVKGDNSLNIRITDSSGKAVKDASVAVHYFMPPMPGMAPMDFNTQAVLKGDVYVFSANIPMEGGWKTEVSVSRPGQSSASATYNLDAR